MLRRGPGFAPYLIVVLSMMSASVAAQVPGSSRFGGTGKGFGFPQTKSERLTSYHLDVAADAGWADTKIDLVPGDRVTWKASGNVQCPGSPANGPAGLNRGWKDLLRILPVSDAGRGALIGRIGDADVADPFLVGEGRDLQVRSGGRLWLGINVAANEKPTGSFSVDIQIAPAAASPRTPEPVAQSIPSSVTQELLSKIPRRVADPDGRAGDMVNFLIVGSEDNLRLAFESAGWVKVDRTAKDAMLHGALSSISKLSYVQMPMSILTLFGRPQDYGFAHAEPLTVVATRHHLRVWRAPFDVDGRPLWVGAGTHDVGFDRDQRNGGITHKIDPDIDKEREYIGKTLAATGLLAAQGYMTPSDPVSEALTATGGSFHSDGRILVMSLASSGADRSADFASLFCSVLRKENPDTGEWEDCGHYLDGVPASPKAVALNAIPREYRVLILPGFMSSCVSSVQAMQQGQEHLRKEHGLEVEYLQLPNASSEDNGAQIAAYLKQHAADDSRKYIVVGYSKGAPDFQVGMAHDAKAASHVAAFISLAGAIGGSPAAEALPSIIDRYTKSLNLGTCQGDIAQAARSLRSDLRHEFLRSHPDPVVPTYSIAATSERDSTSKMLLQAWMMLSAYDSDQDSQVTKHDAIVPGSSFLGELHADHLAVALAFEQSPDMRSLVDHNHYPRAALLESLVRFVAGDLVKSNVQAVGR